MDLEDLRPKLTLRGLTVQESVNDQGMEGFLIEGQRHGRHVKVFVPFMDIEKYLAQLQLQG